MPRAQIFTKQSAEPLKINLSLSDKDSDQAGERANKQERTEKEEEGVEGEGPEFRKTERNGQKKKGKKEAGHKRHREKRDYNNDCFIMKQN